MRLWVLVLVAACNSKPAPAPSAGSGSGSGSGSAAPDDMDEKMRHCPLAIEGARATLIDDDAAVRWEVVATDTAAIAEIRKRAHHVVEFAAGRAAKGQHGGGKGGGTMRNCPVVTSGVVLEVTDIDGGAQLVIRPSEATALADLRRDSRERAAKFPFTGVEVVDRTRSQ